MNRGVYTNFWNQSRLDLPTRVNNSGCHDCKSRLTRWVRSGTFPSRLNSFNLGCSANGPQDYVRRCGAGRWQMIRARKLGHVVLKVRDVQKARDFYTRALGLQVAYEDRQRGAVFLSFGAEHHELALFQLATGDPPEAVQPGLHHMAWQLGSFA